jgi:8-oxo-dGTP pyrophosphatase MutT (NUDIX family)
MTQINIYSNDSLIIIIDNKNRRDESKIRISDKKVEKIICDIKNERLKNDLKIVGDAAELFQKFKNNFEYIEAAGGIVTNHEGNALFIKRWDIWDLPKGKVKKGELSENAAIREVVEETGVYDPKIIKQLGSTYHVYFAYEKWYLKKTFWYLMETKVDADLYPEIEEDITDAVWLNVEDARMAIQTSYRSLRDAFTGFFEKGIILKE